MAGSPKKVVVIPDPEPVPRPKKSVAIRDEVPVLETTPAVEPAKSVEYPPTVEAMVGVEYAQPAEYAAAGGVAATLASASAPPTFSGSLAEAAKMFSTPSETVAGLQEKVRAMLEKGLTETRATYSKAKSAADEASNAMETSYTNAKTGIVEMNVKALEALRTSADANFDFLKSIFNVKSAAELVTLQAEFTRKQVEMLTGQTKELGALAQKVANDTVEPLKAQAARTFKTAV